MDHNRGFFLALIGLLLALGVLMVHSASMTSHPGQAERIYLSRHLAYLGLGTVAAILLATLPQRWIFNVAPVLFALTVGLLVLVLIPGFGAEVNGARRWLRLGPLTIQPAEPAKITLPLCIAWILIRWPLRDLRWWQGLIAPALPVVLILPLVLCQPDLGTALFLGAGSALLLFAARWPWRNFAIAAAAAIPPVIWLVVQRPYQMQRISGFLAAWTNPSAAPYQLKQSMMTLGAGGTWGVGLGRGLQKLSFLPEANTDFVFAVIGEELGLVGTLSVIALWIGVFAFGLMLLSDLRRDSFAYLAGLTLLTQIVLQAAINVGVVTAMVPPKGIPHPLMSYGGSNLVTTLMAVGLIVGLTRPDGLLKQSVLNEDQRLQALAA